MSEKADWVLSPVSEREIAEERRRLSRSRWVGWALAVLGLGLCPLSCVGFMSEHVVPALVAGSALIGLALEAFRRSARNSELARARRKELRETYREVDGYVVEMTVFQGATPTGMDRGAVWFEDGRMYFAGERTSFGLAPPQVVGRLREEWAISGLRASANLRLRARTAAGPVTLGFTLLPLDPDAPSLVRGQTGFALAISNWEAESAAQEGQLPPLAVGPDAPSPRSLLLAALGSTAFWCLIAATLFLLGWSVAWWVVPPVAAFGGCVLVLNSDIWAPRLRWLAWRDRRRLDEAGE